MCGSSKCLKCIEHILSVKLKCIGCTSSVFEVIGYRHIMKLIHTYAVSSTGSYLRLISEFNQKASTALINLYPGSPNQGCVPISSIVTKQLNESPICGFHSLEEIVKTMQSMSERVMADVIS
jgi:hypothetical protein